MTYYLLIETLKDKNKIGFKTERELDTLAFLPHKKNKKIIFGSVGSGGKELLLFLINLSKKIFN